MITVLKTWKSYYAVDGEFKATFLNRRPSSSSRVNKQDSCLNLCASIFKTYLFWLDAVSVFAYRAPYRRCVA